MSRNKHIPPPIGVIPKVHFDRALAQHLILNGGTSPSYIINGRCNDLKNAILRYAEANLPIHIEWVTEYNDLLKTIYGEDKPFTLK